MINGITKLLGLLGNPVAHTLSPIIHNNLSEMLNINEVYLPFCVTSEGLEAVVKGAYEMGVQGLNVTVPHKNQVKDYLVDIDDTAKHIGAVNTLVRVDNGFKGYNTDMLGLLRGLNEDGVNLKDEEIIVLGAGGASKAVVYMCLKEGAKKVYLLNRTFSKAVDIANDMNKYFDNDIIVPMKLEDYKIFKNKKYLVFQTTSFGLHPNDEDVVIEDDSFYENVKIGVDIIFNPPETKFMKKVKNAGGIAYNGLKMLLYQGIIAYELWNNIKIDNETSMKIYELMQVEINKNA